MNYIFSLRAYIQMQLDIHFKVGAQIKHKGKHSAASKYI